MRKTIQFNLNGKSVSLTVDDERVLLWVLRGELNLTGTKCGCEAGLCGSCTILVDNMAVRSCQLPVKSVAGKEVTTIEGLSQGKSLHPLQKAFMKHDALQCGFCTPGMILTAYSLLQENPDPTYQEIVKAMDDNLCRCGSHVRIIQAVQTAARELKKINRL